MARRVIGLDIGTYSVKVTHLESRHRGTAFEIVAYAEKMLADFPFEGDDSAIIKVQQKEAALTALKAEGLFEGGTIVSGLSGVDAQVRTLPVPFSNKKKIQAILGGLLDAQLPLEIDDLVLSWFLQEQPKGTPSPSNQILVAFAKKDSIAAHLELLQKVGIDPRWITHKAAVLFELLKFVVKRQHLANGSNLEATQNQPPLFAIVDIGHHSSGVCVGSGNKLLLARSVLRGGFDITQALAQKLEMSFAEAEKLKIEKALIETETEKAKLLESHLTSEALKESYLPIVRELRQIMLALDAQDQGHLSHIFLVGGGSKVKNLNHFFSDMLKVNVTAVEKLDMALSADLKPNWPPLHFPTGPEAALATSYAMSAYEAGKQNHFDLRKGEFAWRGEYNFMRTRAKTLALWFMALMVSLFIYGGLKNWVVGRQSEDLKKKELDACQSVLGKKVESGARCLAMIKDQISGQGNLGIPEMSASDFYLELAKAIPPSIQLKVTELDITDEKVRINGETSSFDAVDQIVAGLTSARCIKNVEKGRARQVETAVHFQITADLACGVIEELPASKSQSKRG